MASAGVTGTDAAVDAGYSQLFRQEFAAVVRTVSFILHDRERAEDIAQDAFLQLLRHWPKISAYERPGAWVRRVAIRLAVRQVRRDRLLSLLQREIPINLEAQPRDMDVFDSIRLLPGMQRAAIVLFYYEDRNVAEIAQLLGCAEATARVHLHRARRRLAELLGEGDPHAA
jgi:RNA polymerase sigma-70 factor (ECF subfamily)